MKILFSGDLHLGRCSSRLPQGADRRDFSCSSTWDEIVNLAINRDAALVLLSGDIVDENDKFFDAIGPLERGLQKLIEHEIRTLVVASNSEGTDLMFNQLLSMRSVPSLLLATTTSTFYHD